MPWRSTSSVPRVFRAFSSCLKNSASAAVVYWASSFRHSPGCVSFTNSKNQLPVDGERPVVILRLPRDIALRGDQLVDKVLFECYLAVGSSSHGIAGHASPSDIGAHICFRGSLARVPSERFS